jgi:hypothetical protein
MTRHNTVRDIDTFSNVKLGLLVALLRKEKRVKWFKKCVIHFSGVCKN